MSKRVYRIIEYEIPDDVPSCEDWLQRTLARSIDGKYAPAGNDCLIIAATVSSSYELDVADLRELLDSARGRSWAPADRRSVKDVDAS